MSKDKKNEAEDPRRPSIWSGVLETVDASDIHQYVERWDMRSDKVVKDLKEAEQLSAQDFQIRINAR